MMLIKRDVSYDPPENSTDSTADANAPICHSSPANVDGAPRPKPRFGILPSLPRVRIKKLKKNWTRMLLKRVPVWKTNHTSGTLLRRLPVKKMKNQRTFMKSFGAKFENRKSFKKSFDELGKIGTFTKYVLVCEMWIERLSKWVPICSDEMYFQKTWNESEVKNRNF